MSEDIPTIEIDMQKVADNWAKAEPYCIMTWQRALQDLFDRTFLFIAPRGSYNEQTETPAEKRQREQAIQLISQYEANNHRSQTKL